MFNIIVCKTINNGIGYQNSLPWNCKEDLYLFKQKTINNILLCGYNTLKSLPYLDKRTIYCLSSKEQLDFDTKNNVILYQDIEKVLSDIKTVCLKNNQKCYIIGGSSIYKQFIDKYYYYIDEIHISVLKENYTCDKYIENLDKLLAVYTQKYKINYKEFTYFNYVREKNPQEQQYLDILSNIMKCGMERKTRNGITKCSFVNHMKFDIRDGFPLLTTKKMFLKGIIEELLFFIRGDTDSKLLEDKKIMIWQKNTSREFLDNSNFTDRKEGIMGPIYGYNFRFFNAEYNELDGTPIDKKSGYDQLKYVIDTIKNDPTSRRIIMTTFNPKTVNQCVLYPCHSIVLQFYVTDNYLDMYCYNRSSDLFLGLPFNIASSSLFLILISKITKLTPRFIHITLGDTHIYQEHYNKTNKQIQRIPYKFPKIDLDIDVNNIEDIEKLTYKNFILTDYYSYPTIKAVMKE